jgi:hypothetical protein
MASAISTETKALNLLTIERFGDIIRVVGRVIVDDEDLMMIGEFSLKKILTDVSNSPGDIFGFVKSGN